MAHENLPAAVFFDLDGTIADTEPNWFNAELVVMGRYGVEWTAQDAQRYIGSDLTASSEDIVVRYNLPMAPPEFKEELVHEVWRISMERRTHWLPGVLDMFSLLRKLEIPMALVTMSLRNLADIVIEDAPDGTFDVVVAGEDVREGKPQPDAYLLAARRLGVEPRDCLVFEDSPPGVLSAIRAGIHVVAIEWGATVPEYPHLIRRASMEGIGESELAAFMAAPYPCE